LLNIELPDNTLYPVSICCNRYNYDDIYVIFNNNKVLKFNILFTKNIYTNFEFDFDSSEDFNIVKHNDYKVFRVGKKISILDIWGIYTVPLNFDYDEITKIKKVCNELCIVVDGQLYKMIPGDSDRSFTKCDLPNTRVIDIHEYFKFGKIRKVLLVEKNNKYVIKILDTKNNEIKKIRLPFNSIILSHFTHQRLGFVTGNIDNKITTLMIYLHGNISYFEVDISNIPYTIESDYNHVYFFTYSGVFLLNLNKIIVPSHDATVLPIEIREVEEFRGLYLGNSHKMSLVKRAQNL